MNQVVVNRIGSRYQELINDQCKYIEDLKKEKQEANDNYLITLDKLEETDRALENIKKTIERYEKENKALRELVALWV